jgi:hypothetical protein
MRWCAAGLRAKLAGLLVDKALVEVRETDDSASRDGPTNPVHGPLQSR